MKNIKYSLVILVLIGITSCKKYLDTNSDPNNTKNSRVDLVLSSAQLHLAFGQGSRSYEQLNVWNQYWSSDNTVASGDWESNTMSPGDAAQLWNTFYQTSLSSLRYIIQSGKQPKYTGVAKLLMAYEFQVLVDMYGDIPFTDALQGAENTPNRAPKLDKQAEIYPQLLAMANEGLHLLDTTGAGIDDIAGDLIFDGDISKWHSFGNALRLRILMRQSKSDPTGTQAKVAALVDEVSNNGESFTVDAKIQFTGDPSITLNKNPLFTNLETSLHNHYNGSQTSIDVLNGTGDPRIDYLYEDVALGGRPQGDQTLSGPFSRPKGRGDAANGGDAKLYGANVPFILIAPWESDFFLAEAAALGWITDDAEARYNAAVTANFDYYGAPNVGDYLISGSLAELKGGSYDGTTIQTALRSIAIQKWISMNGIQPLESFIERRRSDNDLNPIFTTNAGGFTHDLDKGIFEEPFRNSLGTGVFPSIFYYSSTEVSLNPNVVQRNNVTDKTFWDR